MEALKSKKPLIITLAVLLGIIIATVAVTLIMRGRGGARFTGSSDAAYPYSWTEQDNGAIALTLETGDAVNGAWSLESTDGSTVDIRVGKTQGGKTNVTIKPDAGGREFILLSLASGEDRLAELSLTVMVEGGEDGKLAATVTDHRERAFQGVVRGGEETGYPFTVRGDGDGLTIFIEEPEGYDGRFAPDDPVTREQFATILWRYAKLTGADVGVGEDTNILSYDDAFDVSEWAIPAMQWACGAGVISGTTASTLSPGAAMTRAQAAVMLRRYAKAS